MKIAKIFFLCFLIIGTIYIIRKNQPTATEITEGWVVNEGEIFGTTYHITYHHPTDLHNKILAVLKQVDQSLSMFNTESNVSRLNKNETQLMDSSVAYLLQKSIHLSKSTQGAFDVTVAPLVNAWGFGFKQGEMPSEKQVDSIMQFVGYQKISIHGDTLTKSDSRLMLDFSAIAKGYGVDRVAQVLDSVGIKDYMVEIGGEMRLAGKNKEGKIWTIGVQCPIENPTTSEDAPHMVVTHTDCAIATSGNYHRYYIKNGKKISHTIDPTTGNPVRHTLLSATVRAADCTTADALATSFMVMGKEKSMKYLELQDSCAALLIYANDSNQISVERWGDWKVQ